MHHSLDLPGLSCDLNFDATDPLDQSLLLALAEIQSWLKVDRTAGADESSQIWRGISRCVLDNCRSLLIVRMTPDAIVSALS
jgi:hypothetical protein